MFSLCPRVFRNVFRPGCLQVKDRSIEQILGLSFQRTMKRKATGAEATSKSKRQKEPEKDYCDVALRRDDDGSTIWPAKVKAIEEARAFLTAWYVWFFLLPRAPTDLFF